MARLTNSLNGWAKSDRYPSHLLSRRCHHTEYQRCEALFRSEEGQPKVAALLLPGKCLFDPRLPVPSELTEVQAGIGTYFQPGIVSPVFRFAARTLDEMFAWYLSEHILDGYRFLMKNYHEGDTVCIFGLWLRIENLISWQPNGRSQDSHVGRTLLARLQECCIR